MKYSRATGARPKITIELLNRLKSDRGGFTRDSLQILGIGWPPKKGWRKKLIREATENLIADHNASLMQRSAENAQALAHREKSLRVCC